MFGKLSILDVVILVAYFVGVGFIGWWSGRKRGTDAKRPR